MKLFTKRAERSSWLAIVLSIPVMLFVLYLDRGTIGVVELVSTGFACVMGVVILYIVKWQANK